MKKTTVYLFLFIGILVCFSVSCHQDSSRVIRIGGSSTLYPLSVAVTEEYRRQASDTRIAIGFSGTGGGLRGFIDGEIDIADASRPISLDEQSLAREKGIDFIELPVAYDGIVIAVNSANDWCDSLTVAELKRIWAAGSQNRLVLWSQIRSDWPESRIFLFGPGTNSGTLYYFTSSIIGETMGIRGDFSSSEDDNLTVLALRNNPLGMGFFSYTYYQKNQDSLKLVAIDDENPDNGPGPVRPGVNSIMDGTYQPLSRPLFIYVGKETEQGSELWDYLEFYLETVPLVASDVGLVPLPEMLYSLVGERLRRKISGSMYGGIDSGYGSSVAELLRKQHSFSQGEKEQ